MPKAFRARAGRSDWWSPLLMGAALGSLASWLVLSPRARTATRLARMSRVWEGTRSGLASVRERILGTPELDLDALAGRLRTVPGARALSVRSLGGGIVELLGSAGERLDLSGLLRELMEEPGVSVVINRTWTSTPDHPSVPRRGEWRRPPDSVSPTSP